MLQHTTYQGFLYEWSPDQAAAGRIAPWIAANPAQWQADLSSMARLFPHWLLVGLRDGRPVGCATCQAPGVPLPGGLACCVCRRPLQAAGLGWIGQIPTPMPGGERFAALLPGLERAGFGSVEAGGVRYLLVPLTAIYPRDWPQEPPQIYYARAWLAALGLPEYGSRYHLLRPGAACIYGYGEWQAQPIAEVLGQRMLNHSLSLCKIAAGQSPEEAFIGRAHRY